LFDLTKHLLEEFMRYQHTHLLRSPVSPLFPLLLLGLILLVGFLLWPSPANAGSSKRQATKLECISGGVGITERDALQAMQDKHSFWLTTAIRKSGAFLSGARVTILDAKDHMPLISCAMDGPWLFVDLPRGKYEVETVYIDKATNKEQKIKKMTHIHKGDHHQMVVYFEEMSHAN
jgi:hypothetical protein